jgi:archaemetzincin
MRDAEGGNPLDEEKDFCKNCTKFLKNNGWQQLI